MFHKTLEEANAGDQMGILTKGVKKNEVRRGMVAGKPGTVSLKKKGFGDIKYNVPIINQPF